MRKRAKKLLALLTAVTVTVTGVNVPAAQAAKVSVKASKTTLYYNGTSAQKKATITVKNAKKKVTYSISKAGKKIVKLSKTSGKKITVTAKKAGKATVTVKVGGKKVKSIKFTVKKKTTKATPEPTVAPTQAPTQEPSQEPTVAPTDEPTVAPTDAPSDAPTATPSEEPVKDKSVVTEIKILNDVALTDGDKKAYVYYDVLDQYGESMRESCSINWSTAPSTVTADKQTGRLTITNTAAYKYGDFIVVTGVHAASGVSVSKTLTAGLEQQIDTVNFEGFAKGSEKNKLLETVGKDFAKGTSDYYLLFSAKDQNGNAYDLTSAAAAADVTFTSDNPLLLSVKSADADVFTIGDKTFVGVKVIPGMYADKGGEVNISAISNKTGGKVTKNYVIGDSGVLASLELLAPTTDVCDGDSVTLQYVAKDTAGNEITNYETIVRSTNALTMTASEGDLKIAENNDGTAKITWSDEAKYNPATAAAYTYNEVCDGIARPISLSTVVVGGTNSFVQFQVNDIRIPVSVSVKDATGTVGSEVRVGAYSWLTGMTFTDQYGKELSYVKADAFFTTAKNTGFGVSKKEFYAVSIRTPDDVVGTKDKFASSNGDINPYYGYGEEVARCDGGFVFYTKIKADIATDQATSQLYKACILKSSTKDDYTAAKSEAVGKISNFTITAVPLTLINAFDLSATSKTLRVDNSKAIFSKITDATDTTMYNGKYNDEATVASENGDNAKVSVIGKYKGADLAIADDYLNWTVTANDELTVADGKITAINENVVSRASVFDLKAYGEPAKAFNLDVKVLVNAQQLGTPAWNEESIQKLSKSITFMYDDQVATELSFGANATPDLTDIATVQKDVSIKDQFGNGMTGDVVFKIENIKENTGDLAHVADNFIVKGNGTDSIAIEGAEIGDEFDLVGTVKGTKVTATVHVTVTADAKAYISTKDGDVDKTLRTELKYGSSK